MRGKERLVASHRVGSRRGMNRLTPAPFPDVWTPHNAARSMPKGLVMELSSLLRHKHLARVGRVITHIGRVKAAFTVSSLGYCGVHWLISHGFSIHVLPSAVAFGGVTALVVACLSSRI